MSADLPNNPTGPGGSGPRAAAYFMWYFWAISKNVVGWTFILASLPVAISIPVPIATPMFLIGFAMITFPGKRRLTSRVLRGRQIDLASQSLRRTTGVLSLAMPPLVLWFIARRPQSLLHVSQLGWPAIIALYCVSIAGAWLAIRVFFRMTNLALRFLPGIRRRIRPWLRRQGIRLLPPRAKRSLATGNHDEILHIDQAQQIQRARQMLHVVPHESQRAFAWFRKFAWRQTHRRREDPVIKPRN